MDKVFLYAVPIKRCFLDEFKVKGTAVLPIGFEGRVINMLIKEFNAGLEGAGPSCGLRNFT